MGKSYHALEAGVPARLRKPLKFLLEAYLLAEREATDPWQYGVEFVDLRRAGMLGHDLRILVRLNYAEHAVEVTGSNEKLRRFRPGSHLGFNKRTCVVFTHLGALWVEQLGLFRRPLLVGKKARRSRKRNAG